MATTNVRGGQVLDHTIQNVDLDITTPTLAVISKAAQGTNIALSSTGGDAGTGIVTISLASTVTGTTFDDTNNYSAKDNAFTIENVTTTTKKFQFTAANITAGNTRIVGIPDANSNTVIPDAGAANNFLTAISAAGVISKAQPSFSNISGTATAGQLPATITPTNITGTSTNNSAAAGAVGETVNSYLASSAAVAYTTGQTKNFTSISLTAGDWDVRGSVAWLLSSVPASTLYAAQANIGTTTGTITDDGGQSYANFTSIGSASSGLVSCPLPPRRFSLASTTTIFIIAKAPTFTSGTVSAYGFLEARRMR